MPSRLYPRGFLLSKDTVNLPDGFVEGPFFKNFFIDPLNFIDCASSDGIAVAVLGTCVNTAPERSNLSDADQLSQQEQHASHLASPAGPAQHMLSALLEDERHFFNLIDHYCGRHVILFGGTESPRILTDATGMRTVFYASEGGVVASHALLVEETLGGEIKRIDLPFRYGFPGNHTPYTRTRLLTPNTLYDFAAAKVVRFWPRGPIKAQSAKEAADVVLTRTTIALKSIAQVKRLSLSITAGIDSRTTLALALRAGIPFDGYTYDRGKNTAIDCAVGHELARIAGFSHHIVSVPTPPSTPEELKYRLNKATYYGHHHTVVAPMRRHFGDDDILTVTANLLEIGRFFYKGKEYGTIRPETPEAMCEFALIATGLSAQQMEERYGPEPKDLATEYFADFIHDTDFNASRGIIDSRDQFYWEYKMSAWHGMILLERDFYADCFIPFNSRYVLETLLGVSEWDRKNSTVFKILIKKCAPQLLSGIPINPEQWPLERRSAQALLTDAVRWTKSQWIRVEHILNDNKFGFVVQLIRKALTMLKVKHTRI